FPRGREGRNDLEVRSAIDQTVENIGGDRSPVDEESVDWIPAAWVLRRRNGQLSGSESRSRYKHCRRESGSHENGFKCFPYHCFFPFGFLLNFMRQAVSATKCPVATSRWR